MVAYNPRFPRDDNRSLSPDVAARLRSALTAHWAREEGDVAELSTAITSAAQDARALGMRPEELLLALKAIEEEVAKTLGVLDTHDRDRFRIWLVGACMRAFFAESTTSDA
jgi:hypothetical protein